MLPIEALAFDLDDTLAESKSPIAPHMAELLMQAASLLPVCVISGGRFEQFQEQLLAYLPSGPACESLHLMPTCGTRYYRYRAGDWEQQYAHDLEADEVERICDTIEQVARRVGLWEPDGRTYGPRIENRGSQVTYSALGQAAPVAAKKQWDPDRAKRRVLQRELQRHLPHLAVRAGGSTSIDITRQGIDKAYGMTSFAGILGLEPSQILFIGDALEPGGNDYPVVALGMQTQAVRGADETAEYLPGLISRLAAERAGRREGGGDTGRHTGGGHTGRHAAGGDTEAVVG